MAPDRRRLIVLVGILAALSLIAAYQYWPDGLTTGAVLVPGRAPVERTSPAQVLEAPDVRLRALNEPRPAPEQEASRDPFRYRARSAPVGQAPSRHPVAPEAPPPAEKPAGPPAVPPIAMRFIGLVEARESSKRVAILSDGRGIYKGQEGDIIEGRYRILRINEESVEMAYLDGRGRQTIRLSGS